MSVFAKARLFEQTEPDMNDCSNQTALRRGILLFITRKWLLVVLEIV